MSKITLDAVPHEQAEQAASLMAQFASDVEEHNALPAKDLHGEDLSVGTNVLIVQGLAVGARGALYQVLEHQQMVQAFLEMGRPDLARYALAEKVRTALFWCEIPDGSTGLAVLHCDDVAIIVDDNEQGES